MYHQIALNRRKSILIVGVFILVWLGLGYLVGFISSGTAGAVGGAVIGLVIALVVMAYSLLLGKATVLAISGAHPADPSQYPQLHNIVETLALGAGMPKPHVYVIDDPTPNAFATGMSPKAAAITATTGLLQMMNREELEGVLAHEMSHIRDHDVRLGLIVSTMVGFAALLASLIWRGMFRLRRTNGQVMLAFLVTSVALTIVGLVRHGPTGRASAGR